MDIRSGCQAERNRTDYPSLHLVTFVVRQKIYFMQHKNTSIVIKFVTTFIVRGREERVKRK